MTRIIELFMLLSIYNTLLYFVSLINVLYQFMACTHRKRCAAMYAVVEDGVPLENDVPANNNEYNLNSAYLELSLYGGMLVGDSQHTKYCTTGKSISRI